jgi:hypothetical protein
MQRFIAHAAPTPQEHARLERELEHSQSMRVLLSNECFRLAAQVRALRAELAKDRP